MSEKTEREDVQTADSPHDAIPQEMYEAFKGGKRERDLGTTQKPDDSQKAAPEKPAGSAEADGSGGKKPGETADNGGRTRAEDGRFAKQPVPFDGFDELKPEQQKFIKSLIGDRTKLQNDYASAMGKLPVVQRELQELRQKLAQPQTQNQSQKKVDDFLTSAKFKDYESRFPEDAAGIREALGQTVDQLRNELANSGKPLAEDLNLVKSELEQLKRERESLAAQREADQLSQDHPEWKVIAGWQDDDGNEVAADKRQWHPWMAAWLNQQPAAVRQGYLHMLNQPSAQAVGHVLTLFKRDVASHLEASGQKQDDANPVSQRRSEALQDISPRPSRGGAEQPAPNFRANGSEREAVLAQFYDQFKNNARMGR